MSEPKRALVADDEEEWREKVKQELKRAGCIVDVASTLYEATQLAQDRDYDLIVSDNTMRVRNAGLDFLEFLRTYAERNIEVPFILHTGDTTPEQEERLERLGGVRVLKYIDPLHARIIEMLKQ